MKFRIGDQVRVKSNECIGQIVKIDIREEYCIYISWESGGMSFKASEIELVKEVHVNNKFKIGDKVRTNANCVTYQAEGVVIEYNTYGLVGYVTNGVVYYEPENKLDLIKEVLMTKFQIGDRVRVIDDLDNNPRLFIGCVGKIFEINICEEFGVEYHIDLDNGYDLWATDGEIQNASIPYVPSTIEMVTKVAQLSIDNNNLQSELDATRQKLNRLANDFNEQAERFEEVAKYSTQLCEMSDMLSDKHQNLVDQLHDVDIRDLLKYELDNAVDTESYDLVAKLSKLLDN